MQLDPKIRDTLVEEIISNLQRVDSHSTVQLRGSLAEGQADRYSDIDIRWEVPDERFASLVDNVEEILSTVHPLESIRSDPDFQNSDRRRLLFVQFKDIPLFWRVDLEVFAQSIRGDSTYDVNNPAAQGGNWSRTHSALMNALAAIKALLRGQEENATALLSRAFERVGLPVPSVSPHNQIPILVDAIASIDGQVESLADRINELYEETLGAA